MPCLTEVIVLNHHHCQKYHHQHHLWCMMCDIVDRRWFYLRGLTSLILDQDWQTLRQNQSILWKLHSPVWSVLDNIIISRSRLIHNHRHWMLQIYPFTIWRGSGFCIESLRAVSTVVVYLSRWWEDKKTKWCSLQDGKVVDDHCLHRPEFKWSREISSLEPKRIRFNHIMRKTIENLV